ncbi:MAG: cupredoxin domain-containing protein [Chloroflexota bacterium]
MGWFIYFGVVLLASLLLGWHLGRFRAACTEMTGMMAGMTIGMLGGFALGYGMAAATGRDLFIGNLVGVLLGAVMGGWFGRPGGLMGSMDGAMGGVMGGSMGAMIAAMIYPDWKLQWTGVLFGGVYVIGALALTALIESRAPDHGHLHWLLPTLAIGGRIQRQRLAKPARGRNRSFAAAAQGAKPLPGAAHSANKGAAKVALPVHEPVPVARPIIDYYTMLKVGKDAGLEVIEEAYLNLLATSDHETVDLADRALTTLRDPRRRARYDAVLDVSQKRQIPVDMPPAPQPSTIAVSTPAGQATSSELGDCCPAPKKKPSTAEPQRTIAATGPQPTPSPITAGAVRSSVAAATHSEPVRTTIQLPPKNKTAAATAPITTAVVPTLRSATAVVAPTRAYNGSNATNKQKGSKPGTQSERTGNARLNKAEPGTQERGRQQTHRRGYVEPANSVTRRVMIGSAVGAAAMLLLFWIAFSAASGASGAQSTQSSYSNPAGSVYHVPAPVPSEAQLEGKAVVATMGAGGVQTADLVLDESTSSYSPAAIKVKRGVPVRLNLSNPNGGRDCRSVVDITALGARGFIDPGQPSTMDFTPSEAGVYEINCPMRMVSPSYIVVTE